jgi:ligand-binding SRPBCC domain-containing protein
MKVYEVRREQVLRGTPEEVFPFFAEARNLEAITPDWLGFEVVTPGPVGMGAGTLIQYRLKLHGIGVDWLTSIQAWEPPVRFVDVQVRGPYRLWHHTHEFRAQGDNTVMTDHVRYAIGWGFAGEVAARAFVHRDVAAIFEHRAQAVPALLARRDGLEAVEDQVDAGQVAG